MSLLESLVEELATRVRVLPSGARSLGHLTVIVPTAQAGRRLRQRLATRFGALVPPEMKTPTTRWIDPTDPSLATRTDEIAAFRAVCGELAYAKELSDLRALLLPKALTFADVAALVTEDDRWSDLAALEVKYLAELDRRAKTDRIVAIREAKKRAADDGQLSAVIDWSDIRELLDRYAPPGTSPAALVARAQVRAMATPTDEAARVADYFAAVKSDEALPALCVADPEFFPEIESAFKARGLRLHNPAETKLATSSLGHLVAQVVALLRTQSYSVFSAFVRGGDVRRWLKRELQLTDETLTEALVDLDNRQAEFLPEKIDDIAPKTKGTLRAIFEFVKVQLRKRTLRQVLGSIFKDLILNERDSGAREFVAAAEVVSRLIAECQPDGGAFDAELFELRLEESTYSLEPDEGEVILTDGWLELPFVEADELVIAGLREGCVPESTVGHPFLPDSLRHRLNLPDNASKEARDRAILRTVVASRALNAVRVSFHVIDAKGDVLKPSRLLFETPDDADLVARVKAFYGFRPGSPENSAPDLPAGWKLNLPIPPASCKLTKISPTRLDGYLRCPFTYYLRSPEVLGDKRMDDRAKELAGWEYGNLAHRALEQFGLSPLKDSTDSAAIRDFLDESVDTQLVDRFGTAIPAIVAMQGESIKRRLANFAEIQAKRRAEGWRIVAVERRLEVQYDHTRLYGKCDRIDFNDTTGKWCVIDYKTYDTADKAVAFKMKRDGSCEWKSLQLAIYCAMLDAAPDEDLAAAKLDDITSAYCVLGKTKDEVVFSSPMGGGLVSEAEKIARELIRLIERGIFWPPAPTDEWRYDFADWLMPRPEESVSEAWIRDQEERVKE